MMNEILKRLNHKERFVGYSVGIIGNLAYISTYFAFNI
ncbi:hypothetical protein EMA8858_02096 [Emticicia aquatica]|uniref:Uncharacterized protein n=1 Tax=Emticicia aquatica TaxID=1681835 RepID=A0ABM9AQ25_9BACT|nr:hypothetical protein EMA8858_02096 [Emticicia aquatica]